MIKQVYITLLTVAAAVVLMVSGAQAQDKQYELPREGNFQVSVNLGAGTYIGKTAQMPDLSEYSTSAPVLNWFEKSPILEIEGRWFFKDRWALKLTGGFAMNINPKQSGVAGMATSDGSIEIPTYLPVSGRQNLQFSVATGVDHYWSLGKGLMFRLGGEGVFAYATAKYKPNNDLDYYDPSKGMAYTFAVSPVAGIDYYITGSFFVSASVRPVTYQYFMYCDVPQPGLKTLSADSHGISVLGRPELKIGFNF